MTIHTLRFRDLSYECPSAQDNALSGCRCCFRSSLFLRDLFQTVLAVFAVVSSREMVQGTRTRQTPRNDYTDNISRLISFMTYGQAGISAE